MNFSLYIGNLSEMSVSDTTKSMSANVQTVLRCGAPIFCEFNRSTDFFEHEIIDFVI